MFGWEFPPNNTGGLGTACYGLTKALSRLGIEITLVLPTAENVCPDFLKVRGTNMKVRKIVSSLTPYMSPSQYSTVYHSKNQLYGRTLIDEVMRYSEAAESIALEEDFDVIHCHDWLTYEAGIRAKMLTGKPLIAHVHATEFDRTGGLSVNQLVYDVERRGMEHADAIIAVSNYTKNKIIQHYGITPEKIIVVHNAVDKESSVQNLNFALKNHSKIVLFLGRVTLQKGPDYFLYAARKVLDVENNTKFVMAGTGDMEPYIIGKAIEMGMHDKVIFTGFLKGEQIDMIYRMADVYVMPSVSEPFGITALEAIKNGTPIIISKNSGVSEIVTHCLKVDFWDINQLANKIVGVLRYKELPEMMSQNAGKELTRITWENSAVKCARLYNDLLKKTEVRAW